MKKLLIFGNGRSAHLINWSRLLAEHFEVYLITLSKLTKDEDEVYKRRDITVIQPTFFGSILEGKLEGSIKKILIVFFLPWIHYSIKRLKPDIIHVHYASSYGFLIALLPRIKDVIYILSVWGSDLFNFPYISKIHKYIFQYTLSRYKIIQVTSNYMVREIKKWVSITKVHVVPFPININRFKNNRRIEMSPPRIGTVKTLEKKYGIDFLIKVASILVEKKINFFLEIYGDGQEKQNLIDLVKSLGLTHLTTFHGHVAHDLIHEAYQNLDIYLALSVDKSETYGVAILEASACELPVIVSNVGGLPEVVVNQETGIVVDVSDITMISENVIDLILNTQKREYFGKNGRDRVINNYSDNIAIKLQLEIYSSKHILSNGIVLPAEK